MYLRLQHTPSAQTLAPRSPAAVEPAPAPRRSPGARPQTPRVRDRFRRDVEGLRAVAILLVVFYHCRLIPGGYVGVDVFFVISGFLITGQLVHELQRTGRISLLAFYARRARRILPAATLTTVATVIAAGCLLAPLSALQVFSDARSAALFGANFHFAAQQTNYFDASLAPSPFVHYWSLSVEEQFYALWPLLLLGCALAWTALRRLPALSGRSTAADGGRPRLGLIALVLGAVATASLAESILLTGRSPVWAYYSISSRGWELAVGALLALILPVSPRIGPRVLMGASWLGLGCIVAAAVTFNDLTPFPGYAALLPVAGAAAVIISGSVSSSSPSAQTLLGTAPFQRVGSCSYSWYLWHWPVLVLAPAVLGHSLSRLEALAMVILSLVLALLSYRLIERPSRRIQVVVRRPWLGVGAGAALVATSLAVVSLAGPALASFSVGPAVASPARATVKLTPARLAAYLREGVKTRRVPANLVPRLSKATQDIPLVSKNGCLVLDAGTKSPRCVYGDESSHTTVVLFGDSHAAAWFPAMQAISRARHWRLIFVGKAGCPAAEVLVSRHGGPYNTCVTWRRNAEREIAKLHPALVVMTSGDYLHSAKPVAGVPGGHGSTWMNGMAATFSDLHKSAGRVVYIADVPRLKQPGAYCVSAHMSDVRACTIARRNAYDDPQVRKAEVGLATSDGITPIDPTSWFCTASRCPVIVGNLLVYRDDQHMIPQWSRFLAPVLALKLVPIMREPAS